MKVVGLTGGIATGKSEIATLLRKRGFPVIDADQIARDVVAAGSPILAQLVHHFGPAILLPDGSLNRPKLGEIVFGHPKRLQTLNQLTHSAIIARIQQQMTQLEREGAKLVFLEVPLLYETGMDRFCEAVILVTANPELQLERLKARSGLSDEAARARIVSQMPQEKKSTLAEHILDNSGHILQAETRLNEILRELV